LRFFGDRLKIPYFCQACPKKYIDLIRKNIRIISALI